MVISHEYRYVYVALSHTGSTAVSRELCINYKGEQILRKHSFYSDFLDKATPDEKTYFVFSGIRNPMDEAVSKYLKVKRFDPNVNRTSTQKNTYRFVLENDPDFPSYFKYRFKFPYNNWSSLAHRDFDFIMKFEQLPEDLYTVLSMLKIEQIRPLPVYNKTAGRRSDYVSYYTPEIIDYAKRIFGPFMLEWGYKFPPHWGVVHISRSAWLEYRILNMGRDFYWKYLMNNSRIGRFARWLR